MIAVDNLPLKDAKLFRLKRFSDSRGWFTETMRQTWIDEHIGPSREFMFECSAFNNDKDVVRGMHAQSADAPQAKLVSVLSGSIRDYIIDARVDSPTYGKYASVTIDVNDPVVLYVPRGFYHGYITLEPNTLVTYKMDNYYTPAAERGVRFDDPFIAINWQPTGAILLSDRDQKHPYWDEAYKFEGNI